MDSDSDIQESLLPYPCSHDASVQRDEVHAQVCLLHNRKDRRLNAPVAPIPKHLVIKLQGLLKILIPLVSVTFSSYPDILQDVDQRVHEFEDDSDQSATSNVFVLISASLDSVLQFVVVLFLLLLAVSLSFRLGDVVRVDLDLFILLELRNLESLVNLFLLLLVCADFKSQFVKQSLL